MVRGLTVGPLVVGLSLAASTAATASGTIACTISDAKIEANLEAVFSGGLGEALQSASGSLEVKASGGRPTVKLDIATEHIKQFWMQGRDLHFRLYEAAEADPAVEIDLVIKTEQDAGGGDDEPGFSGGYEATLNFGGAEGSEEPGSSSPVKGRVTCSAGY